MAEPLAAETEAQQAAAPPGPTPAPVGSAQAEGQPQATGESQESSSQGDGQPGGFFSRFRLTGLFSQNTGAAENPSPPGSAIGDEERVRLTSKYALELEKWMGSTVFSVGLLIFSMLFWTLLTASWITWRWWFSMIMVVSHVIITALLALLFSPQEYAKLIILSACIVSLIASGLMNFRFLNEEDEKSELVITTIGLGVGLNVMLSAGFSIQESALLHMIRSNVFVQVSTLFLVSSVRCAADPRLLAITVSFAAPYYSGECNYVFIESLATSNSTAVMVVVGSAIGVCAEYLLTGSGVIKAGSRGGNRPSTFASLGVARGQFNESFDAVGGEASRDDVELKSPFSVALRGLGSKVQALPTGKKLREEMLQSNASHAFAMLIACSAIARGGRPAVEKPSYSSRAPANLLPAVEFTRSLFDKLKMSQEFNGVSSLAPEIALLIMASGGSWTTSLATLTLSKQDRQLLQTSLSSGLGNGARTNRSIIKDQERSATGVLAFGFTQVATKLVPGPERSESTSWGFIIALMVVYAVSAIDVSLNQNLVGGLMIRAKDCISVTTANAIMTFHKVKRSLIKSIVKVGTVAAKHQKITVVAVDQSLFTGVAQMFGHSVSETDSFKRYMEEFHQGEEGGEEGKMGGKPEIFTLMQESGYDHTREGEVMLAIAAIEERIKKASEQEEAAKKKELPTKTPEASAAEQKTTPPGKESAPDASKKKEGEKPKKKEDEAGDEPSDESEEESEDEEDQKGESTVKKPKSKEIKSLKSLPSLVLVICPGHAIKVGNSRISETTTQQFSVLVGLPLEQVHSHVETAVKALYAEAAKSQLELPGIFIS